MLFDIFEFFQKGKQIAITQIIKQQKIQLQKLVQTYISMLQQFKNALHMSKIISQHSNSVILQFSPKKTPKQSSDNLAQSSHFGSLAFSRHFKQAQQRTNKLKSWLEGIGITIDDTGHLIIGEWKNNQIDGKYFVFKPNLVQQNDQHQIFSAICQYGNMKAGQLDSENYIYNISGTLAKGEFQCNKIIGKCYIVHCNKLFIANQLNKVNKIQCQIVNFSKQEQKKDIDNPNILKIPKINSISKSREKSTFQSNKSSTNLQQLDSNIFVRPNKFLSEMVLNNQSKQSKQILKCLDINQKQYFIGFLENVNRDQKLGQDQTSKRNMINGFGVIFKNEWPSSYGTYKLGKLQGLGRVYETQMSLFDGYFIDGQLMEGFIIDYYANTTSFGHHSSLDPQFKKQHQDQQSCFIITNTFETASFDYIVEYRRNFHLKSLNFNNSYFNSPKLIHRSPWPYNIINKLYKRTHIETILKSFRPTLKDVQISLIQKKGQSSDNRFEKELVQSIKESKPAQEECRSKLFKEKSSYIQSQINKNLISREQIQTQEVKLLPNYFKQYYKIDKKQKEILQAKKNKQTQKKQQKSNTNHSNSIKTNLQKQHKTPQKTPALNLNFNRYEQNDKTLDLTDLVNEYNKCQTARKHSVGNTSRSMNTDRKISPKQIYSKRQLIKQDHYYYMGKKEVMPIKQYPSNRRKVDLDLIYRQYLHK